MTQRTTAPVDERPRSGAERRPGSQRPGSDGKGRAAPANFSDWRAQLSGSLRAGGAVVVLEALALVGLMVVGSAVMWIGLPVGWLWLASHLQHGSNPSIGPYLLVAVGLPITMVVIAKGLRILDRAFSSLAGFDDRRIPLPWMKSVRGERGLGRSVTVLEVVMLVSVALAGAALGIWFLFFAGAPPSSVGNGGLHP